MPKGSAHPYDIHWSMYVCTYACTYTYIYACVYIYIERELYGDLSFGICMCVLERYLDPLGGSFPIGLVPLGGGLLITFAMGCAAAVPAKSKEDTPHRHMFPDCKWGD